MSLFLSTRLPGQKLGLYLYFTAILFASQQYWPAGRSTAVYVHCGRSTWGQCTWRKV